MRILSDGLPHCLDVGVFPHPFSCKKFINCFRNPGTGIQGSIYQCPSYLAGKSKAEVQAEYRKQITFFLAEGLDFLICEVIRSPGSPL